MARWHRASDHEAVATDPWLLFPLFMPGALTVLIGQAKYAGKSTLVLSLLAAMLRGEVAFAGELIEWGPVVYLTEQPPASFRHTLFTAGILGHTEFYYAHRADLTRLTWEEIVEWVGEKVYRESARYLVVDTFSNCVGLKDDEESRSGGKMREAALVLQTTAATLGCGALVCHHARKVGKDDQPNIVDLSRGHSALSDVGDILAALRNPTNTVSHPERTLEVVGRFADLPPDPLRLRFGGGRYVELEYTARAHRLALLFEHLPEAFDQEFFTACAEAHEVTREQGWQAMRKWQAAGLIDTVTIGHYRKADV